MKLVFLWDESSLLWTSTERTYNAMDKNIFQSFFDGFRKIIVHEYVSIKIENHPIWVSKKMVFIFSTDPDENPYRFVKMSGLMESGNLFLDPRFVYKCFMNNLTKFFFLLINIFSCVYRKIYANNSWNLGEICVFY